MVVSDCKDFNKHDWDFKNSIIHEDNYTSCGIILICNRCEKEVGLYGEWQI